MVKGFCTTEDTESHGVFFLCPPDGKSILRETLCYSVVSFIYDAKIIPRQSAMSRFVSYCPDLSLFVAFCLFLIKYPYDLFGGMREISYLIVLIFLPISREIRTQKS